MTTKYLLAIIVEIIEANDLEENMLEYLAHFLSFDLVNKYDELGNMDKFVKWVASQL